MVSKIQSSKTEELGENAVDEIELLSASQERPARRDTTRYTTRKSTSETLGQNLHKASSLSENAEVRAISYEETREAFLEERRRLMDERGKYFESLSSTSSEISPEERHAAMKQWREENAESLAAQRELAIKMAALAPARKMQVPDSPQIPANATPELSEFLIARHDVMKGQATVMNELSEASSEERQKALENWREANKSRVEAMTASTRNLSESSRSSTEQHQIDPVRMEEIQVLRAERMKQLSIQPDL